ncbi:amidase family protein [Gammaproteobacteria bacterium]|nr:amidase family protein [Gammaproteobacteria bacterium]
MDISSRNTLRKPIAVMILSLGMFSCSPNSQELDLVETTISEIQEALLKKRTSCYEVVLGYLERIEKFDNPEGINAISMINSNALARAQEIDRVLAIGGALPELFCAPIVVKDNFDTHDLPTTGGSVILRNSYPPNDAFMVSQLRSAGAIIIAKTNMAEWAFSPRETVSSSVGRTANAYDTNFVPAGSSGGTASAVAANFAVAGMGSDTGNSIRGPASHLALFGIRSTIGLTSRDGVIPLIFDRDIAGPMSRTVEDGVKLFNVVSNYDENDPLAVPDKKESDYREFLKTDGLRGKRIGVFNLFVDQDSADVEINEIFFKALDDMRAAGAIVVNSFSIENFDLISSEVESCHSFRYDLSQYFKTLEKPPLDDIGLVLQSGDFAVESRGALEFYSQFSYQDPPDERENPCAIWPDHSERNLLLKNSVAAMDDANLDAVVFPTWSNPPAPINKAVDEYLGDNSQGWVPAAGLPAVTVPMGFWRGRLPAGIQIVGRPYSEGMLIEIAYGFEQATHHRKPPLGLRSLAE